MLVALEPDLGTTGVITLTAFTMFFVAGAQPAGSSPLLVRLGIAAVAGRPQRNAYQLARVTTFLDPWRSPPDNGYPDRPGPARAGARRRCSGTASARAASRRPAPAERGERLRLRDGRPGARASSAASPSSACSCFFAYRGIRVALGAPDTFGALLAVGITAWLAFQAFINIGVVVNLLPITGITLPVRERRRLVAAW